MPIPEDINGILNDPDFDKYEALIQEGKVDTTTIPERTKLLRLLKSGKLKTLNQEGIQLIRNTQGQPTQANISFEKTATSGLTKSQQELQDLVQKKKRGIALTPKEQKRDLETSGQVTPVPLHEDPIAATLGGVGLGGISRAPTLLKTLANAARVEGLFGGGLGTTGAVLEGRRPEFKKDILAPSLLFSAGGAVGGAAGFSISKGFKMLAGTLNKPVKEVAKEVADEAKLTNRPIRDVLQQKLKPGLEFQSPSGREVINRPEFVAPIQRGADLTPDFKDLNLTSRNSDMYDPDISSLEVFSSAVNQRESVKAKELQRVAQQLKTTSKGQPILADNIIPTQASATTNTTTPIAREAKDKFKDLVDLPPTDNVGANAVREVNKNTRNALAVSKKLGARKLLGTFMSKVVDTSGNIKNKLTTMGRAGKEAIMHHDLTLGSSARSKMLFDEFHPKVYGGLNSTNKNLLDDIIDARATMETALRNPDLLNPGDLKPDQYKAFLDDLAFNNPERFADLNARADEFFEVPRKMLDELLDEGLITPEVHNALRPLQYEERRFIQHIDPDIASFDRSGRRITVPDSGIKRLAGGSTGFKEKDSRVLMADLINRSVMRVYKNRANKSLYQVALDNPDNGLVRIMSNIDEPAPGGFEKVSVMIGGERRAMLLPTEMAKEWVIRDPAITQGLATTISYLTGTKVLKAMATGINPEFALSNMPRDLFHVRITTTEHSKFLPLFMIEMAEDYAQTAIAAFRRKGAFIDYINEGGGMDFLTNQGGGGLLGTRSIRELDTLAKWLGYIGETSEIWTRLALRNRALKNGKPAFEATHIARNYLDFNQGGSYAKALDSGIPYLNAGIQGTRGIFRAAKNNPALFTWKVGEISTLASGLYLYNRLSNPEALKGVTDSDKVNSWIFTTPHYVVDKDGQKRYRIHKVPKDQGQRIFATATEAIMERAFEGKIPSGQIIKAITDFTPIMPENFVSPGIAAFMAYAMNKDTYTRDDIWKGNVVQPDREFYDSTNQAFIDFTNTANELGIEVSPIRLERAFQKIFTYGNIYTDLLAGSYSAITDPMSEAQRDQINDDISKSPFIRRFTKLTPAISPQDRELVKSVEVDENTRRLDQNRELKEILEGVENGTLEVKRIRQFIAKQPRPDQQRIRDRWKAHQKIKNVPNSGFLIDMRDLPPESRAKAFIEFSSNMNQPERNELIKTTRQIPGFRSERFRRELLKLQLSKKQMGNLQITGKP